MPKNLERRSLETLAKISSGGNTKRLTFTPIDKENLAWQKFCLEPRPELLKSLAQESNFINYAAGAIQQTSNVKALKLLAEFFNDINLAQLEKLLKQNLPFCKNKIEIYEFIANSLINNELRAKADLIQNLIIGTEGGRHCENSDRQKVLSNLLFNMIKMKFKEAKINATTYLITVIKYGEYSTNKEALHYLLENNFIDGFTIQELLQGGASADILFEALLVKPSFRESLKLALEEGNLKARALVLDRLITFAFTKRSKDFASLANDFMISLLTGKEFDNVLENYFSNRVQSHCRGSTADLLIGMFGEEKLIHFISQTTDQVAIDNALQLISRSENFVRKIMTEEKYTNLRNQINLALAS